MYVLVCWDRYVYVEVHIDVLHVGVYGGLYYRVHGVLRNLLKPA